jgi:hypothetical protein
MTMTEIRTNANELRAEFAPLYCRYSGQCNAQSAYIDLDPEGETITMEADYDHEIDYAVPMRVWHGRTHRIKVSPFLTGRQIADLLEDDDFQALARDVAAGFECYWDGSNLVGKLTDDARSALEAMERMAENIEGELNVIEAGDYVQTAADAKITVETTDEEIAKMAEQFATDARAENIIIEGDLEDRLRWLRDRLQS